MRRPIQHRPPRRRLPRFTLGVAPPTRGPRLPELPWNTLRTYAMAVLGVAVLGFGGWWLWSGSTLRVGTVIVIGTEVVDANAIVAAAAVQGQSLLTLDTTAVESRILAIPGVAEVKVDRDWPRTAVIQIREMQGWGYWQAAGIRALIDVNGRVLEKARLPRDDAPTIYEAGGSPLQAGETADPATVALVTRLLGDGTFERLGATPLRFEFDRQRGLTVRLEGAPAAVFGDSHDYEFKVAAWAAILDRVKTEQIPAGEIDLRFGRELVVR
ncbi:MAG: cell division protein FtsQ/DivIB [Dehalococcoidia bacterium]